MRECTGPIVDSQCGVYECPSGSREPSEEDCDRCQAVADDHAYDVAEARREQREMEATQ